MTPLEALHPRSIKHLSAYLQNLISRKLWLKVIVAMVLGIATGIALGPTTGWVTPKLGSVIGSWLALPGQIFLAVVQMIVVPLVVASVIRGIAASENIAYLKKMGLAAISFFVATTTIAITIGIALAYLTKPGEWVDQSQLKTIQTAPAASTPATGSSEELTAPNLTNLPEAITGLLPKNPLSAMVDLEMLQVVIFAIIVGIALISMQPKQSLPIMDLLGSVQEVCMTIVKWAMILAPYAVFGLMARITSIVGAQALLGMSVYVGTVLLGLFLLLCLNLTIYGFAIRKNPLRFFQATKETMLLAFSTSSSAAVMPLSIRTAEEKLDVRPTISQFIIPLGATINMNGTALYQGVATIFLAQVYGIDLSFGAITLLIITAVGSSIGSPATPGVGIVILSMVLATVGIPAAGIGLIMGVDRILDMSRTAINVNGDLLAAKILDQYVGGETSAEQQRQLEEEQESERQRTNQDVIVTDPA